MTLIVESEKVLKSKSEEMERKLQEKERELQEKGKELEKGVIPPITELGEFSIVQALAQVSLKELELTRLKQKNKNLEVLAMERECERKI